MNKKSKSRKVATVRALTIAAGGALSLVAVQPAFAVSEARSFLRWSRFESLGVRGETVTIANVEGGHPKHNHLNYNGKVALQLAWPWDNSGNIENLVEGTRNWNSLHATAVAGTLVGQGQGFGRSNGIAPGATLTSASFSTGIDPEDGSFEGFSARAPTPLIFGVMALVDPATAAGVAANLGIEPYPVATVVHSAWGIQTVPGRLGEDPIARTYSMLAYMTGATIVCPAGDDGDDMQLDDLEPPEGSVRTPGAAYNVISVGRTDEDFMSVPQESSEGPGPAAEWGVIAGLFPPGPPDPKNPLPMDEVAYQVRPGPHVVAPGTNLTLPGSQVEEFNNPSTMGFSDFWTGTSFASAIVAGAAALVHDAGTKGGLWATGHPSNVVTKACIINSAQKIAFSNMGMFGMGNEGQTWITTRALDDSEGGGQLNLERLRRQFVEASPADVRSISGFTLDSEGNYTTPAVGTDPTIPFVSYEVDDPDNSVPDGGGGPGGGGPIHADPAHAAPAKRPSTLGRTVASDPDPTGNPLQFGGFGENPPLDGSSGFMGAIPEPRPPCRTCPRPPAPVPPDPPCVPGFPCPGGQYFTGWDHGMIGTGRIDIPLGFIIANSSITVTLCWNRTDVWDLPDLTPPLAQINPALVLAPPFVPVNNNQRVVGGGLQQAPEARPATRKPVVQPKSVRSLPPQRKVIGSHGCGGHDAVLTDHQGNPLNEAQSDAFFDRLERDAVEKPKVRISEGRAFRGAGLDIQYQLSPAVAANADFVAALERSAQIWEAVSADPIIVTVSCDFIDVPPDAFIAATSNSIVGLEYGELRALLAADSSAAEAPLVNALPATDALFATFNGPMLASDFGFLFVTASNARALGVDLDPGALDAGIVFNQNFPFDTNPDDGRDPGTQDLVYVMTHEIGHMLGFVSSVDIDFDPSSLFVPSSLDLFRFPAGGADLPETVAEFTTFAREFRPGVECVLTSVDAIDDVGPQSRDWPYRFSTGTFNGDGRQSSHWKDDVILGSTEIIGVMDPTTGAPTSYDEGYPKQSDLLALSLIGWDIQFLVDTGGPTGDVPVIGFDPAGGSGDVTLDLPSDGIQYEMANLDIELWRRSIDGSADRLVAASRGVYHNTEHIAIGPGSGAGTTVEQGNYFIRMRWVNTLFDFGGYLIGPMFTPSTPFEEYEDVPNARTEYGLAWYVDLAETTGIPITDGGAQQTPVAGDLNTDGVVNSADVALLLSAYGAANPAYDLNADGRVNSGDLAIVLGSFSASR